MTGAARAPIEVILVCSHLSVLIPPGTRYCLVGTDRVRTTVRSASTYIVRATPLGTGFVDIFIDQIHSESDDQIQ